MPPDSPTRDDAGRRTAHPGDVDGIAAAARDRWDLVPGLITVAFRLEEVTVPTLEGRASRLINPTRRARRSTILAFAALAAEKAKLRRARSPCAGDTRAFGGVSSPLPSLRSIFVPAASGSGDDLP
jgi:hypothetical protein